MQFGWEISTLNPVAYSCWFHFRRKPTDQEKNEGIGIVPKYYNSLKTFPYAIQKHLSMHQSDFPCKYKYKSLKDQCFGISKEDNCI